MAFRFYLLNTKEKSYLVFSKGKNIIRIPTGHRYIKDIEVPSYTQLFWNILTKIKEGRETIDLFADPYHAKGEFEGYILKGEFKNGTFKLTFYKAKQKIKGFWIFKKRVNMNNEKKIGEISFSEKEWETSLKSGIKLKK